MKLWLFFNVIAIETEEGKKEEAVNVFLYCHRCMSVSNGFEKLNNKYMWKIVQ